MFAFQIDSRDSEGDSRLKDRISQHKGRSRSNSVSSVLSIVFDQVKRSREELIECKRRHFQLSPQIEGLSQQASPISRSEFVESPLAEVPPLLDLRDATGDSQTLLVPQIPLEL